MDFLRGVLFHRFWRCAGCRFNDRKLVVAFRALMIRPLQTGVTRHRFCAGTQSCQSTFEQCLPKKGDGAARWQSDPSHRICVTVRMSHPSVSVVKSFPLPLPDHPGYFFCGSGSFISYSSSMRLRHCPSGLSSEKAVSAAPKTVHFLSSLGHS